MHTVTANKVDCLLYVVKRTGTRGRYMVQICIAIYLPADRLPQRTEVSVQVCPEWLTAQLSQAAPCLSVPAQRGIPLGQPQEAPLAELRRPSGRRVLMRRCLSQEGSGVTSLCKAIIFVPSLLWPCSHGTNFRQEQYVLQPAGKFQLNLAESEITTTLNSYLFR